MLHHSGRKLTTSDEHSPLPPNRHCLAEFESYAVWPVDGVRVNFLPGPHGMFFDIDLRELVNQAKVDGLAHLVGKLGTTLGRDVAIRDEGSSGWPVLQYTTATEQFPLTRKARRHLCGAAIRANLSPFDRGSSYGTQSPVRSTSDIWCSQLLKTTVM